MSIEACPACTADIEVHPGRHPIECAYCRSQWPLATFLCPVCANRLPSGADECPTCGEPLSTIARVLDRQAAKSAPRFLDAARLRSISLKEREERSSHRRMETLHAIDIQRDRTYRDAQRKTEEAERKTWIWGGSFAAAVVIIILIVAFLFSQPGP